MSERKKFLKTLIEEVKLMPEELTIEISYRVPQVVVNGLVAGDCNAPNAHVVPYEFSIA